MCGMIVQFQRDCSWGHKQCPPGDDRSDRTQCGVHVAFTMGLPGTAAQIPAAEIDMQLTVLLDATSWAGACPGGLDSQAS